ncbi:MAG: hypothetical protein M3Q42_10245 [Pseudomonadota bacterium]|nr:hypothetical protein [Pseudomonadota bacterium]
MDSMLLLMIAGVWGVLTIAVLKRRSGPGHPQVVYRGAGFVLILAGAVGFALTERLV